MDLTDYTPTALSSIKSRLDQAKYDSTMLVKTQLEVIEEVTNGKAVLVDASNPVTMSLEMSACMAANLVQENFVLLRKQYPTLAADVSDLYHHMSDTDHINRFATPSKATFSMLVAYSQLKSAMVYDSTEGVYKAVFPRDTQILVDGIIFTTLYPIVFRMTNAGAIQVSYDAEITNPVYSLSNTIISSEIRKTADLIEWLCFNFVALQIEVVADYSVLEKAYYFKKTIAFNDLYYHARVFYRNDASGTDWVEMATTHTEQVFDIVNPTAVLSVADNELTVTIPPVYLTSGLISGNIRVDIYSTKGELSLSLKNYTADKFVVSPRAIDDERDIDDFTNALADFSYSVFSTDIASGGSSQLDFETLRQRVIYNAVGPVNIPITNVQTEADANVNGFSIVKNVDLLTNRVFLATRKLPTPTNKKLITPANIGMVTFASTLEALTANDFVINNGDRLTIKSKAIWKSDNGQIGFLSKSDVNALYAMTQTAMLAELNSATYYYTPFYYVLDASEEEFEIRSYSLDQPMAKDLNFVRQNQTLQLYVNTNASGYSLVKTSAGYELRITTTSGTYYQNLQDSEVGVQLAFYPYGETRMAYINGIQESKTSAGERTFLFKINTEHDINSDDLMCVTNSQTEGVTNYQAWIPLGRQFFLVHWTTSINKAFVADETDALVGKFILPRTAVGNSLEKMYLQFGHALSSLWRRARSYSNDITYRKHTTDIPLLYENDVYEINPETGSMLFIIDGKPEYKKQHSAGDVVLDAQGNVIYQFKVGDIMYDENNLPIKDVNSSTGREMDLLVVDGRYFFANDSASIAYRDEIENILVEWITDTITNIQKTILEQTRVFFYPKSTLGTVTATVRNSEKISIAAEQSFVVSLSVTKATYEDMSIRDTLRTKTVSLLDSYVGKSVVNMTEISDKLKALYGDSVKAFSIYGLGGTANYDIVSLESDRNKLCLKKELIAQADKTLIVQDDVTVEFSLAP